MTIKLKTESARHKQNQTRKRQIHCMEDRKLKQKLTQQVQHGLRETTMSIDELSRASEVSRTTIYRIKSCDGKCTARLHTLNLLLRAMNGKKGYTRMDDPIAKQKHTGPGLAEKELLLRWLEKITGGRIEPVKDEEYRMFRELGRRLFGKEN